MKRNADIGFFTNPSQFGNHFPGNAAFITRNGVDFAPQGGRLEHVQEHLDGRVVADVVGDDEVAAGRRDGNEPQVEGFGDGAQAQGRIGHVAGNAIGALAVGVHFVGIAVDTGCVDAGALQPVVEQDPQGGAGFPIDEAHHRLGQVGHRADAQGVAVGHHQPLLEQGEAQDAAAQAGEFLAGHDDIGLGLARIVQMGSGHMGQAFGQMAQCAVAGGEAAVNAHFRRRATDMVTQDVKGRIAAHEDNGLIQPVAGGEDAGAFFVGIQQPIGGAQAEGNRFGTVKRQADQPVADPSQGQACGRRIRIAEKMHRLIFRFRLYHEKVFHPAAEDTRQAQGDGGIGQIAP
ncbi:hypothetical protein DESC_880101 [Desulfosarcina cetonica]|nr:hypothetical protein DESC_880101 [Desulfosarcina cetonica]